MVTETRSGYKILRKGGANILQIRVTIWAFRGGIFILKSFLVFFLNFSFFYSSFSFSHHFLFFLNHLENDHQSSSWSTCLMLAFCNRAKSHDN